MKDAAIFMVQQCYSVAAPLSSALVFYPASDSSFCPFLPFIICFFLLHAWFRYWDSYCGGSSGVCKLRQEQQRKLTLALLDKAMEVCDNQGVDAETVTEVGDPKKAVCSAVKKFDISLLVMGEHGLSKIKRALVGNVSNYCVQNAKCPVLVVKRSQCP